MVNPKRPESDVPAMTIAAARQCVCGREIEVHQNTEGYYYGICVNHNGTKYSRSFTYEELQGYRIMAPVQSAGTEYSKIKSVYMRDEQGKMQFGKFSTPEFEYLCENEWQFTEKVDGTNIRLITEDGKIKIGGKTERAQIPTKLYDAISMNLLDPYKERILEKVPNGVLYGEGFGAGIQKGGGNYGQQPGFILFDVKIDGYWLRRDDVIDIADHCLIPYVPCVGCGTLYQMILKVEDGLNSTWGNFPAEGIVARPVVEMFNRAGHRIITKIKGKDFV